jgi:hypothetical protein
VRLHLPGSRAPELSRRVRSTAGGYQSRHGSSEEEERMNIGIGIGGIILIVILVILLT